MVNKSKSTGSIPSGIGIAAAVSIAVTLLGAAVIACLVDREVIAAEGISAASSLIWIIGAALGALTAMVRIKRMRMQMCMLSGGCYFLTLIAVTALFFGGQYAGMGVSTLCILCGCGAVAILSILAEKKGGRKIRKRTYR